VFESVEQVEKRLRDQGYICGRNIATVVYLATRLQKPVLVEGPAGVGKTELSKVVAGALGMPLVRLQCYEGLDEAKALYEWEYSKQLLYTQMLRDKIGEVIEGAPTLREASERIAQQDRRRPRSSSWWTRSTSRIPSSKRSFWKCFRTTP
jgi:MoxR-like ATPase